MVNSKKICVVGLGYVGLPLAVAFGRKGFTTMGLDVNKTKIQQLKTGHDAMGEVTEQQLKEANLTFSDDPSIIKQADIIIVSVPTPINDAKQPDITLLKRASSMIGKYIQKGSIVVYESTVYPGCTEEDCIPLVEQERGLVFNKDFFAGYSPERINPGDKKHTIEKIIKVVSGSTDETLETLSEVYGAIIDAGIHKAPSMKVAEAAKVIENVQRDLNIALFNELSIIFDRIGISTKDVTEAAGTKWNFHKYTPGLVGGHCIGVDPYYLTYKAAKLGYHAQVILAGRQINDDMPILAAQKLIKAMIKEGKSIKESKILILGLAFRENVKDARNSKIKDMIAELASYGATVIGHDPLLDETDLKHGGFTLPLVTDAKTQPVDAIVLAAPHDEYLTNGIADWKKATSIFFDLKSVFSEDKDKEYFTYLTL
ncbi:MAG: UDP-N-acetyl-D-galactosamine dehydrogenase [Candidatus Woesearchaeota archaeon]|jgi:UDP-N-acetyl-D-galactosamine dehydrogenase